MNRHKRQSMLVSASKVPQWLISYANLLTLALLLVSFLFISVLTEPQRLQLVRQSLSQSLAIRANAAEEKSPHVESLNLLRSLEQLLLTAFAAQVSSQTIHIQRDDTALRIDFSDFITFLPNSADISEQGQSILREVGRKIAESSVSVNIENSGWSVTGKTNPDDWQKFTAKAKSIAQFLISIGVDAQSLSIVVNGAAQKNNLEDSERWVMIIRAI